MLATFMKVLIYFFLCGILRLASFDRLKVANPLSKVAKQSKYPNDIMKGAKVANLSPRHPSTVAARSLHCIWRDVDVVGPQFWPDSAIARNAEIK
jgi:hypothetical protein